MTELAFHFGTSDPVRHTSRLIRKALQSGARVVVLADSAQCSALDAALWNLAPTEFLPHCDLSAPANIRLASPVLLAGENQPQLLPGEAPFNILVNLAQAMPEPIDHYEKVIEIVGVEEADRVAARSRWKIYKARGLSIQQHDLSQR